MTISELIKKLEALREQHGDVPVRVQTLSQVWDPDPAVVQNKNVAASVWVLLNP